MNMKDKSDLNNARRPMPMDLGLEDRELIRDWEFLFWAFLIFGLTRLTWLYLCRPVHEAFQLGLACGFVLCGILGFLMRWVLSPKRR
jgi:CHASE2 domain-containing sensor protein